jgi:hypothetical protein
MAAKQHSNFWGWASDHWFLTFLLAGSAISAPAYLIAAIRQPAPPAGTTPFPISKQP